MFIFSQRSLILVLTGAFALCIAQAVHAKELAPKPFLGPLGVGADATLTGVSGVSGRYQLNKRIGFQAIFGFARLSFDEVENAPASPVDLAWGGALRGDIRLVKIEQFAFSTVVGVSILSTQFDSDLSDIAAQKGSTLGVEAGFKAEFFVSDFFSIHTEIGVAVVFLDEAGNLSEDLGSPSTSPHGDRAVGKDGTQFSLGAGELLGQAGFTFWFNWDSGR